MSSPVFISYSRRNSYFARQLALDLGRAGIDAWLDTSDIPLESRFEDEIKSAIGEREFFLLLVSPESASSDYVLKELAYAKECGKRILYLRIAGTTEDLPGEWRQQQFIELPDGYRSGFDKVVEHLKGTSVDSLTALLHSVMSVKEAGEKLGSAEEFHVAGQKYLKLPVEPTAYTMSWLVAPADAMLELPKDLAVHLKFSGPSPRNSLREAIEFLMESNTMKPVWALQVCGPRNKEGNWELPLVSLHVWQDAVNASVRALQQPFMCGKTLHFFLDSPQVLVYELASSLRAMQARHLYQLNYEPDGPSDKYVRVL